ncbi:hypothetical protein IEQ34_002934 [Dendrobium chrysotoxum]|uniref:Uncharacterized protein n=1 Tax=Dendrobium chrysotoxum TaxID=161865 RepID=A0AAV7HH78_DENCH|nr:hypothetical protein IEQ34_002934 [Dendrobium chrysotoxum]
MLKKSVRVSEVVPLKSHSKQPGSEEGLHPPRKKKADEVLTVVSKGSRVSPSKSYIPEDVLNHQYIGRRRAEELEYISNILLSQYSDFMLEMTKILNDWNKEFVKSVLSEKEAQQLSSAAIEEFKKSYAFKIIIEDHIQEARIHIYDVEVKALEVECIEDGFIRGFMKGASGDVSSDSGGEELESELQQAFALEENEDDVEILYCASKSDLK